MVGTNYVNALWSLVSNVCLKICMSDEKLFLLRQKHHRFIYERFSYEVNNGELSIQFFFTLDPNIHFVHRIFLSKVDTLNWEKFNKKIIENWIFNIGMVELLSYWKAACPVEIMISAGSLNDEQITFWRKLLQNGLSEFFFVNGIDGWQSDFVRFSITQNEPSVFIDQTEHQNRYLIPVGGGKDSSVTAELMKSTQYPVTTFTINPNTQLTNVLQQTGIAQTIEVKRELDPQLVKLNQQGYFNGHTPFSAMVSFISTFVAYVFDFRYIALSNEQSANEGNTFFLGQQINHQYSKSFEYEKDFRSYCTAYLSSTIEYFSFLRPLHELQIAKIFARYPQYFMSFLSCNRGQKTGKWCGECPKCLFAYLILSPFIPPAQMVQIFGQDLLSKESLIPILDELTGVVEVKSLDCVGTRTESLLALHMILEQRRNVSSQPLPELLQHAQKSILSTRSPTPLESVSEFMSQFHQPHFLSDELAHLLRAQL